MERELLSPHIVRTAPRASRLLLFRTFDALASLRIAVVTMLALGVACAAATFYEAKHGTAAAQRAFYRTPWFALLLATLAANILFSMLKRYPWNKHHAGFLMAHAGILAILVGSVISLRWGLDSTLALYEGETGDRVSLQESALEVRLPGDVVRASFVVDFETDPPGPGRERRLAIPGSDVTLVAEAFLPHAGLSETFEEGRVVTPAPLPEKDDRRMPAVKVRLEGPAGRSEAEWLLWTESREIAFPGGTATVAYRSRDRSIPFRVTLLKFTSDKYPGSSMAATYQSHVRVDDPEEGVSDYDISMNHPLHYRGYVFFQASFVEGEPMMSILSVARAPGLPLVYAGVALVASGVVWMFYLKPYLVRCQAAQALAAQAHPINGAPLARRGAVSRPSVRAAGRGRRPPAIVVP